MGFFLNADLREILKSIPNGTVVPCNADRGFAKTGRPFRLKKIGDGKWLDEDTHKPYPVENILVDISNKRISLGILISIAERNETLDFHLDEDSGQVVAYNTDLEGMKKEQGKKMPSDSLIIFREVMPKVLVDAGLADSPAKLTKYVYDKICARFPNHKRHAHGLDNDTLEKIKKALDEPLAVIRSKTKSGDAAIAVLTKEPDWENRPTLVIMQQDKDRGDNYIASIYGKENVAKYLKNQWKEGNLIQLSKDIETLITGLSEPDKAILKEVVENFVPAVEEEEKISLSKVDQIVEKMKRQRR